MADTVADSEHPLEYDDIIEMWRNGNLTDAAKEILKLKHSELILFCDLFAKAGGLINTLHRNVMRMEQSCKTTHPRN